MGDKQLVIFEDDFLFFDAVSMMLLENEIDFVRITSFNALVDYLSHARPFMLFATDHAYRHFNKTRINEIRQLSPDIAIALFTYRTLTAKEIKELKILGGVSLITINNSMATLGMVIDVLCAGYRIFDSNSTLDNKSQGFYRDVYLSPMENKVLSMIMQGMSIKNASKHLNIAEKTVMTYKRRSLAKLGAQSLRDFLLP